ncbi:hypothetical protein YPPY96_4092, partial [Yersinia pestis PY-96]
MATYRCRCGFSNGCWGDGG